MEVDTFLTLALRLKCVTTADRRVAFQLVVEIGKMLTTMRNRLRE